MIKYKKIWFNPAWKEGADSALYGNGGFYETANEQGQVNNTLRSIDELGYEWIFNHGRILDYGCGNGAMVNNLNILYGDNRAYGYDPLTNYSMPSGTFSTVFCVHVIEHVKDPIDLIHDIRAELRPNGILCLVCHNVVGWPNKRAREHWHRWLFGKEIVQIIEAEGFKLKARLTWGGSTAKIRWIKEAINWTRKKLGIGDVQMVIMEKT